MFDRVLFRPGDGWLVVEREAAIFLPTRPDVHVITGIEALLDREYSGQDPLEELARLFLNRSVGIGAAVAVLADAGGTRALFGQILESLREGLLLFSSVG